MSIIFNAIFRTIVIITTITIIITIVGIITSVLACVGAFVDLCLCDRVLVVRLSVVWACLRFFMCPACVECVMAWLHVVRVCCLLCLYVCEFVCDSGCLFLCVAWCACVFVS